MALRGLDLRDGVQGLVGYAERDLAELWRQVRNAAEAEVALHDVLPALIDTYGSAAAALAADWYDDLREKVGVGGSFRAFPAEIPDTGAHALAGWAVKESKDMPGLQSLVLGGMQRRIQNFSRQTVMESSYADPRAEGWQRVGSGKCASGLCDMLIGRGAVYRSQNSASFAAHDSCRCSAAPRWGGEPLPVKPYTPSLRHISDADRARLKAYLRDNGYQ